MLGRIAALSRPSSVLAPQVRYATNLHTAAADNIAHVRRYFAALEAGTTGRDLASFWTQDAVFDEYPNRLVPNGAHRDVAATLKSAEAGQKILVSQRYEVKNEMGLGNRVGMEVTWTGKMKDALGSVPAGGELKAYFSVWFDFRDGKIAAQRNYDCFEPF